MSRQYMLADRSSGGNTRPTSPEWKEIQEEERLRRQTLLEMQKTARLARKAVFESLNITNAARRAKS